MYIYIRYVSKIYAAHLFLHLSPGTTYFFKGKVFWEFDDLRMKVKPKSPALSAPYWLGCPNNIENPSYGKASITDTSGSGSSSGFLTSLLPFVVAIAVVVRAESLTASWRFRLWSAQGREGSARGVRGEPQRVLMGFFFFFFSNVFSFIFICFFLFAFLFFNTPSFRISFSRIFLCIYTAW